MIATNPVPANTYVTISSSYNGITKAATFVETTAPPSLPVLSSLSLSPTSVTNGSVALATVTLTAAAPSTGVVVSLSNNLSSVAALPGSVTIPAGATSTTFTVATNSVSVSTSATISATYNGTMRSATLTVMPSPPPPTMGAQIYVSSNGSIGGDGSINNPWDLATALSRVSAGETVYLREGTYFTGYPLGSSLDTWFCANSGTSSARVTIQAYPGEVPVIKGHFRITGSYVTISRLVFAGPLSPDSSLATARRENQVWLKECHDVTLEACEIKDNDYHAGLYVSGVSNIHLLGCYIHDNGRFNITNDPVSGSYTWNVDHGVYWGSSNGGGSVISNCVIEHNRGYGLQLYPGANDIEVSQNTLVNNGNSGLIIASSSDRIQVINNISAYNERNRQIRVLSGSNNVLNSNLVWSPSSSLSGIENGTGSVVTGTIIAEPGFSDRVNHNYHLKGDSPAIDEGVSLSGVRRDYDGVARPQGIGHDLGAFETLQALISGKFIWQRSSASDSLWGAPRRYTHWRERTLH